MKERGREEGRELEIQVKKGKGDREKVGYG